MWQLSLCLEASGLPVKAIAAANRGIAQIKVRRFSNVYAIAACWLHREFSLLESKQCNCSSIIALQESSEKPSLITSQLYDCIGEFLQLQQHAQTRKPQVELHSGTCHLSLLEPSKAVAAFTSSVQMHESIAGGNFLNMIFSQISLGNAYICAGDGSRAVDLLSRCSPRADELLGADHLLSGSCRKHLVML